MINSITPVSTTSYLQFGRITLNEDYANEWKAGHMNDFVCLLKNGNLLRETLYRVGGLGTPKLNEDKYFMLLKYTEAYYPKHIMEYSKSKDAKHLMGCWCILDKEGNERVNFDQFKTPYLVRNSCLYSMDMTYYNIETGECYGHAYHSADSRDFVFLETSEGVKKINKADGSFELFEK